MSRPHPTQEFRGTERFSVRRRIGAGGMGIVFEAWDGERGHAVALKTMGRADPVSIYRLKQEFRSLADFTHPNLVALFDLVASEDQWFFTMELVAGVDFLAYVGAPTQAVASDPFATTATAGTAATETGGTDDTPTRRPTVADGATAAGGDTVVERVTHASAGTPRSSTPAGPDLGRLRASLLQLAEGLAALHGAGKLHRDIKPSNVLVTPEGRVVLLDFGLVREVAPGRGADEAGRAGTPQYMAPEQMTGGTLSPASDWYGVGVMLYEALTGRLPFEDAESSWDSLLCAKQRAAPRAPRRLAADVDADLEALCLALLAPRPEERPDGREVLARLGRSGAPAAARPPTPDHELPLLGRAPHLEALRDAFAAMRQGRAVTVHVRGFSGNGKTRLVRQFLDELGAASADVVVLEGRCHERDSVPYKALDTLVDALGRFLARLPPEDAVALLPANVAALARIFPVLRLVDPVARAEGPPLAVSDPRELRRVAFAALREQLARIAARWPLVLFVDDLQWGDVDSAALLAELLGPPDPPPLLFIGCHRDKDPAIAEHPELIPRPPGAEVRELLVGTLDQGESLRLALALLGDEGAETRALAATIAEVSRGGPFFIQEMVRHAQLRPPDAALGSGGSAAERLQEAFRARHEAIPADARRLLDLVCLAARPLALPLARAAAELSGADEHRAIGVLRTMRLIRIRARGDGDRPRGEELEPFHDRIREAVLSQIGADPLRELHQRLALALEASDRADAEALARHFHGAGRPDRAAHYAVVAAAHAARTLAFDRAAGFYRMALELAPPTGLALYQLRSALAEALANAGRGADAAEVHLAAAREAPSPGTALDHERQAAEQLLRSGHLDRGEALLRQVLAAVGVKLPARGSVPSLLARRARLRLRGLGFRSRDAATLPTEEVARVDAIWTASIGLAMFDLVRGADFGTRHLLLALAAGEPYRVARGVAVEASFSANRGVPGRPRTDRLIALAAEMAARVDHPHAYGLTVGADGLAACFSGEWRRGQARCDEAEAIFRERCRGASWETTTVQLFALTSLWYAGEVAEVARRVAPLRREARTRGDRYAAALFHIGLPGLVWLVEDAPEEALTAVEETMRDWPRERFAVPHYYALLGRVHALLYRGDGAGACAQVRQVWPALARSLLLEVQQLTRVDALRLRASAALAAARPLDAGAARDRLLRSAAADAARIRRESLPCAAPTADLVDAGAAGVRGDARQAATLLARAVAGFDASDTGLYAAAARHHLGHLQEGEVGSSTRAAAAHAMETMGVRAPARFAAMLAPGFAD